VRGAGAVTLPADGAIFGRMGLRPDEMTSTKSLPVLLGALLLGGVATLLFLLKGAGPGRGADEGPLVAAPGEQAARRPRVESAELAPPTAVRTGEESAHTTVLWPLRVELDLAQPGYLPKAEGVAPLGSGRTARLSGRITGTSDQGVPAEIRIVAGTNAGRVLRCDGTGTFGANDLYPGLAIVEVHAPGIPGSRREKRLRRGQETLLNIGYGRPGSAVGRVQDRKGEGIEGARVTFDGRIYHTGPEGELSVPSVAGGEVLVEIEAEGYAAYQENVWIQAGRPNTSAERLTFTLERETQLSIALRGNVGGPGPAQVILLPGQQGFRPTSASAYRNSRFPFHRKNPIELWPGSPFTIGGLPQQVVKVYVFRPGAQASLHVVNLRSQPRELVVELDPAPMITGRVTYDGTPVAGATVALEAPDRTRATLSFFREASYYLETAVIPELPPAAQEVVTGPAGRFLLSAWEEESPARYIEARGPDGKTWAGSYVRSGEKVVDLELRDVDLGSSELALEFPGRFQGLPVEVFVNGAPLLSDVLTPSQELVVPDLVAGIWCIRITWHAAPIYENAELEIDGQRSRAIKLPPECIHGQDEEAWVRAGREYPGT